MSLRKRECPLQSTESGQINWAAGLWFFLFMGILLCALLQLDVFRSSARYMEDALAASNLAAAVIDVEEYGISHALQIDDPQAAHRRYITALKGNLNLDDNWECPNKDLISGPVKVVSFIVYNVSGNNVIINSFDGNGTMSIRQEPLGRATAPNGVLVESTGIYSEITYCVRGFLGVEINAHNGKLVDVVKNDSGLQEETW